MSDTLSHILRKFNVRLQPDTEHRLNYQQMPIDLPIGRNELASLFAELGFKSGAEIGVEQGEYSEVLARANPQMKLYLVDAWARYRNYRDHVRQEKLDGFYETTKQRMAGYNCEIIKAYSVEAAQRFDDGSMDVIYVDANHKLEFVIADLAAWVPKVRPGGICAGHDWFLDKRGGPYHVPIAVRAYTEAYRITPYFICRGDHSASWFFVKS